MYCFAVYFVHVLNNVSSHSSIIVKQTEEEYFNAKKVYDYLVENCGEGDLSFTGFQKITFEEASNWYNNNSVTFWSLWVASALALATSFL